MTSKDYYNTDAKTAIKQDKQETAIVKKSNIVIRQARFSFSLQQQKIICYIISHLKDTDTSETPLKFDIKSFYDFMDVDSCNYERIRDNLKAISDKSWTIMLKDGTETIVRFIQKPYMNKRSGLVRLYMDRDMLPFLQYLRTEYTQYNLFYILTMKSQYSIRMYEMLKSVLNLGEWNYEVDYLKKLFMCGDKYKQIGHFNSRILEPAINEINEKTDLNVTHEFVKKGNKIVSIKFNISQKEMADRIKVRANIREELDK